MGAFNVVTAGEGCPHCGHEGDFEIWIHSDVIAHVCPSSGAFDFVSAPAPFIVVADPEPTS
jgi:hypothetical protein